MSLCKPSQAYSMMMVVLFFLSKAWGPLSRRFGYFYLYSWAHGEEFGRAEDWFDFYETDED